MARIEEQPGMVGILHNDVIDELNAVINLLAERLRRFDFSSKEYSVCKATQFAAIGALWMHGLDTLANDNERRATMNVVRQIADTLHGAPPEVV